MSHEPADGFVAHGRMSCEPWTAETNRGMTATEAYVYTRRTTRTQ